MLTAAPRPLRLVAFFGVFLGLLAMVLLAWVVWARLTSQVPVQGWASTTVILLVTSGGILFSLGIMAEYLGIAAKSAMGKPLYLVVSDPADGPLGPGPAPPAPAEASPQVVAPSREAAAPRAPVARD